MVYPIRPLAPPTVPMQLHRVTLRGKYLSDLQQANADTEARFQDLVASLRCDNSEAS